MNKAPLYQSISNDFRKKILGGEWKPGDKLPNQRELAETYQTTVMTIRQALDILISESLIEAVHGVGTFVTSNNLLSRNYKVLGFKQEMHLRAIEIQTKITAKQYEVINQDAAKTLKLPLQSGLCVLSRVRFFKKFPIVYQHSYIAPGFRSIIEEYTETESLYDLINRISSQTIKTWKEIIRPVLLNADQAEKLLAKEGDCALKAFRCTYASDNTPILYDEAFLSNRHLSVTTEKSGNISSLVYQIYDEATTDPFSYLRSITG
jgi:DNA-binding GntR family transcriptional regulator